MEIPLLQFFVMELKCPLLCQAGALGPDVQNHFVNKEVDMPAVVPHRCLGPASQKTVEVPLLQFFDKDCGHARRGATAGAGLDVQHNCGVAAVAVLREAVEIPRCSSWTRSCSCAQPVETPQAQFLVGLELRAQVCG